MTPAEYSRAARRLYDERRARDDLFGDAREGFGEPGWDMLLLLAAREDGAVGVDELLDAAAVPAGLAATYLSWLESRQLVRRCGAVIEIEDQGRLRMISYLDRLELQHG